MELARDGAAAQRRLDGLADHCDREGGARITLWANEMWECDGMWASHDMDDETPAMFDSLDELLDAMANREGAEVES